MLFEQLCADFLQRCSPVAASAPWVRFEEHRCCWRLPMDWRSLVATLRETYDDKTLLASGLFERFSDKTIDIADRWLQSPQTFLALRTEALQNPFDLLTADGSVSGDLPVRVALADHAVKSALDAKAFLLAAFSVADIAALRAVGLPVTSALGLERFSAKSLEEFRDVLTSSSQSSEPWPQQLILVGWSPSGFFKHRPQLLETVVDNLRCSVPIKGLLPDILLWEPSAHNIQEMGHCAALGSRDDVVATILKSLDESAKPLALPQRKPSPVADVGQAAAVLRRELLRHNSTKSRRRRRIRQLADKVESAFAQPYLAMSEAATDREEKSRLVTLAGVERILIPSLVRATARLEYDLECNGRHGDGAMSDILGVMKMMDAKTKLMKGKT
jgi:hypothetical protein